MTELESIEEIIKCNGSCDYDFGEDYEKKCKTCILRDCCESGCSLSNLQKVNLAIKHKKEWEKI